MKISNLNKIIKINVALILLVSTFSFSFAQGAATEKEISIVGKFLNIFKTVEVKQDFKPELKQEIKTQEIKEVAEIRSAEVLCENKIKINTKKEKITKQIKNQILDKNNLVSDLMEISASSSEETKILLDEKIIKLDNEVSDLIKLQKSLFNILNSTSTNINLCDNNPQTKNKKIKNVATASGDLKIKELEKNIDTKAESVNKIIKIDIKELLKKEGEKVNNVDKSE